MTKKGQAQSNLEAEFDLHIRALGLPVPEREYRFHPVRKWRLDRAWPDRKIAVEIDGGTWIPGGGRHNRPGGYSDGCRKCNEAGLLGWTVYHFTTDMVEAGEDFAFLERVFGEEGQWGNQLRHESRRPESGIEPVGTAGIVASE